MKEVRVAIFEDMENMRALLKASLESKGYSVVYESDSLETALQDIDLLQPGDIDLAIVDGNLTEASRDAGDGARIISALKRLGKMPIIGFSSSGHVPGADVNILKGDFSMFSEVINSVDGLPLK